MDVLGRFSLCFLKVMFGESAIVLQRAAIAEAQHHPVFGQRLSELTEKQIAGKIIDYLVKLDADGTLEIQDFTMAFEHLIGP